MNKGIQPDWIAVDWGTSRLRAWAMGQGGVLEKRHSDDGAQALSNTMFEPVLEKLVADWLTPSRMTSVVCCGMAGSRQGWVDAGYRLAPCPVTNPLSLVRAPVNCGTMQVWLVPGIKQETPADVMRGEETQISGFLAQEPDFDGVLCLPGTHTKWVRIKGGQILDFKTFITGELFALLSEKSILRHSVAGGKWDQEAFASAFKSTFQEPRKFAGDLFMLRAQSLVADLGASAARARLSGLLLGLEISAAQRYLERGKIRIVGAENLAKLYADALAMIGVSSIHLNADTLTLSGLLQEYTRLTMLDRVS